MTSHVGDGSKAERDQDLKLSAGSEEAEEK